MTEQQKNLEILNTNDRYRHYRCLLPEAISCWAAICWQDDHTQSTAEMRACIVVSCERAS